MRPATPISFVLLCLVGSVLPSSAAPMNRGTPNPPPAASRPAPAEPADDDETVPPAAPPAAGRVALAPPQANRGERRRRSYASCNRDSHKRNLRGGARRRFLIRCKLGYEQRQPSRPAEPPASGRRP